MLAFVLACLLGFSSCDRRSGRELVSQYTAPVLPQPKDFATATEAWRWILPETAEPLLITALGDVFVRMPDGSVMFLDTESGKLIDIATTTDEWNERLRHRDNVESWFRPAFVAQLQQRHKPLRPPYVYSPTIPLVLNGKLTPENYTPSRWDAHLHVMGQIHRQVKDLPPGTRITKIHVDPW